MNKNQAANEKYYQTTMAVMKKLLKEGAVTEDEYAEIDAIFREKYSPVLGSILFDIRLINPDMYGNM